MQNLESNQSPLLSTRKRVSLFQLISLLLSMTVLIAASHPSVLADNTVSIDKCYSYQEDLSISSNVSITSSWGDHANLLFEITNTGEKTIHNWFVSFDLSYDMEGIWEANLIEHQNNMYTVMNGGHNMDILPNQRVSFGMTVKSEDGSAVTELPTFMFLNTKTFELELSSLSLRTQLYSDWGQGCTGNLTLVSNVDFPIMDWTIRFTSNRPITEVSNAVLTQGEDGVYTLTNNGNNANIEGHTSLPLSFNGGEGQGLQITLVSVRMITFPMTLTQDENHNGIADILERIGQGQQQENPDIDLELDTDEDGVPDYYEKQIGADPNSKDSDSDGIDDGVEVALGMDPLVTDSDSDGIPDAQEDDDGDGLTLLEEIEHETYTWTNDSDVDGISDGDEIHVYGTDPLNEDTDGDGIEDGDELKLGLDPKSSDSDGDGVGDGQERFPQTRSEVIEDAERPAVNQVDVALTGTGCLDSAMKIKDMYGEDTYCSDLVSLVGAPVSIEYEGEFDEATITFHYDESKITRETMNLEDSTCDEEFREEDLGILWYDEETGLFVDYEATVDTVNNTVSCKTTHFSEYMLYWKTAWNYRWTYELQRHGLYDPTNPGENGQARSIDYVLCIQHDQSMSEAQKEAQAEIVHRFIDNLRPNDRIQFVNWSSNWVFGGEYTSYWTPSSDKNLLRGIYDNLSDVDSAYCPYPEGIVWGGEVPWIFIAPQLDNRINFTSSHEIVSIIFQNTLSYSVNGKAEMLSDGIKKLYTWGYPSTYLFELPSGSYSQAAGKVFDANSRGGLIDCDKVDDPYEEFCRLYLLNQGADSDGDGLLDVAEKKGMVGTNGKIYKTKTDKDDSDEDGLKDREEMGAEVKLSVDDHGNVTVDNNPVYENDSNYLRFAGFGMGDWVIYSVKSDPNDPDTDGDGLLDSEDSNPKVKAEYASYCLYDSDHADLATFWKKYEEKKTSYKCFLAETNDRDSFLKEWMNMGIEGYRIWNVHMNYHGTVGEIASGVNMFSSVCYKKIIYAYLKSKLDGFTDQDVDDLFVKNRNNNNCCIEDLPAKKIENTLHLDCCESGNTAHVSVSYEDYAWDEPIKLEGHDTYDYYDNNGDVRGTGTNCAVSFLQSDSSISTVRAWDGTYITVLLNNDKALKEIVRHRLNGEQTECIVYQKNTDDTIKWTIEKTELIIIE